MGHRRVGVVQVREHHNPVVCKDVWNKVVLGKSRDAGIISPNGKEGGPHCQSNVGNNNGDAIRLSEQSRTWEPVLEYRIV